MSYGRRFKLALFTDDAALALRADQAGIDYIGVDLERLAKLERQGHLEDVRISQHQPEQLVVLRRTTRHAVVFARTNPPHAHMRGEIDYLLELGAEALMLPMFTAPEQVDRFVRWVDGRCRTWLLLETPEAVARLDQIVRVQGIDLIHIGLNDLHRGLRLSSHFEVLVSSVIVRVCDAIRRAGIALGCGTLARPHDKSLPIDPDLVYAQYPRLKVTMAFLSRYFMASDSADFDLAAEIASCRRRLDEWSAQGVGAWEAARIRLRRQLRRRLAGPSARRPSSRA